MRVKGAVRGVGGGKGVEVDFGLGAGFDDDGSRGIGGYALTAVGDSVSLVLRLRVVWSGKGTYWPAAL